MANLPCPKCKKAIPYDASVCSFCQSVFTSDEISQRKYLNTSTNKSAGWGCLILIGLSMTIGWCMSQPKSPEEEKALFVSYYKSVMPTLSLCESSTKNTFSNFANVVSGKMAVLTAYQAAAKSKTACDEAQTQIASQEKPTGLPLEVQKNFDENASSCFAAASGRSEALGLVMKALDGDLKPSLVNDLMGKGNEVQRSSLLCAVALGGTSAQLGIKPEELK